MTLEQIQNIIREKVTGKIEACHDDFGHHYKFVNTDVIVDSVTQKNVLDKPHLVPWAIGLAIVFLEEENRFERLKDDKEREDLIRAAKLQYTDVRDNAGTIGGQAHDAIEDYTNKWIQTGQRPEDIKLFVYDTVQEEPLVVNGIGMGTKSYYLKNGKQVNYKAIGGARSAEAAYKDYGVTPVACELLVGVQQHGAGTLDLLVLNRKGELELWDWKTSNNVNDFYALQVSAYARFFEIMTGLKIKRCRIFKIDKTSDAFKPYDVPDIRGNFKIFKALSLVADWTTSRKKKLIEDKNYKYENRKLPKIRRTSVGEA